jgi:flagellar motor switch protein FliN/FliY
MKPNIHRDEVVAKLQESLLSRLVQALEAMIGTTQRCHFMPEFQAASQLGDGEKLLGWKSGFSAGPSFELRVFAAPKDWRLFGKTVLEAAGVDELDDATLESTFLETLMQAASAFSQDLSGLAGKKWEASGSESGVAPESSWDSWGYRLPMGAEEAKLMVQVSPELVQALAQPSGEASAPKASEASAAQPVSVEAGIALPQYDLLLDVELPVSISFGRAMVPLKEVLRLSSGSIVELNRAVTEPVEVIVNNCVIARGEVVVVEGNYGVRIQQIVSRQDRLRTVN